MGRPDKTQTVPLLPSTFVAGGMYSLFAGWLVEPLVVAMVVDGRGITGSVASLVSLTHGRGRGGRGGYAERKQVGRCCGDDVLQRGGNV